MKKQTDVLANNLKDFFVLFNDGVILYNVLSWHSLGDNEVKLRTPGEHSLSTSRYPDW
jgi:hypothetical protein